MPYPSQSNSELCSQTHIYDGIGLLTHKGVMVVERGSTPYPSPCQSPSPLDLCSQIQ